MTDATIEQILYTLMIVIVGLGLIGYFWMRHRATVLERQQKGDVTKEPVTQ